MLLLAGTEILTSLDVFALPFVASAGVVAMAPRAPLARPAALVLGYGASGTIATAAAAVAAPSIWTATAAAVPSIVAMLLLKAPHAPAAVAAVLIGLTGPGFDYLLTAVLPGVGIVIAVAVVAGHVFPAYGYPASWR
jgi:CBS-domain-containing membrane protein